MSARLARPKHFSKTWIKILGEAGNNEWKDPVRGA